MSRGKKAFLVSPILALAIAFMWASPAPAELTISGSVAAVDGRVPGPASNLQVEVDLGAPSVALSWGLSESDFVRQSPVGLDFTSGGSYVNTLRRLLCQYQRRIRLQYLA